MKKIEMIGKIYGNFLVKAEAPKRDNGNKYYICQCSCGSLKEVEGNSLRRGQTTSCGCKAKNKTQSLVGKTFDRLTVKAVSNKRSNSGCVLYECVCFCGKTAFVDSPNLKKRRVKSCGCLVKDVVGALTKKRMTTHGATSNKIQSGSYISWLAMRRRCLDPKFKDYPRYGGAGIEIYQPWINSFEKFLEDMGTRPEGYTLDRINTKGNYSPDNCRWSSPTQQMNNTTKNRILEFEGESHTLSEWSRIKKIPRARLSARINTLGWSVEKALGGG